LQRIIDEGLSIVACAVEGKGPIRPEPCKK
jgi:hypothetical protein